MDWIGKEDETPETDVLVGRSIEDARRAAGAMQEVEWVRELSPNGTYTMDRQPSRLTLLVEDGVVVAATRF